MEVRRKITSALIFCALVILVCTSCNKEGRDEVISHHIPVNAFHTINIDGVFTVYIVQDNSGFITFTGTSKHVGTCTATVTDSVLTIDGSKHGEWLHPGESVTEVYVHVDTTLRRINVNEDCILKTVGSLAGKEIGIVVGTRSLDADVELNCGTFYYWNNPNGTHMIIRGTTKQLKIWNSGLGSIDAGNCTSDYVEVTNGGQNDCKVRAVNELVYGLTGVGNIIYFGNPPLITESPSTGSGELIKGD